MRSINNNISLGALSELSRAFDECGVPRKGRKIVLPAPDGFVPPTTRIEVVGFEIVFV